MHPRGPTASWAMPAASCSEAAQILVPGRGLEGPGEAPLCYGDVYMYTYIYVYIYIWAHVCV